MLISEILPHTKFKCSIVMCSIIDNTPSPVEVGREVILSMAQCHRNWSY